MRTTAAERDIVEITTAVRAYPSRDCSRLRERSARTRSSLADDTIASVRYRESARTAGRDAAEVTFLVGEVQDSIFERDGE